jgi:hypothetical protein
VSLAELGRLPYSAATQLAAVTCLFFDTPAHHRDLEV